MSVVDGVRTTTKAELMAGHRSTRSRASRALLIALLPGVIAGPAPASASAADAIGFAARGYAGGPVLAGDGRVVITERLADGARRIVAIDPRTHAISALDRLAAPADPRAFQGLTLAGGGAAVTATLDVFRGGIETSAGQVTPAVQTSRAFTVLPALAPLAVCDPLRASSPPGIRTAAGDGFVALAGDDCGEPSAVHIRKPNGRLTIPAQSAGAIPPSEVTDLRAAGPFVTWTETRFDGAASFVAARAATGEVLLRTPALRRYGLGADGTIVVPDVAGCALRVVSLVALAQRSAGLPPFLCPGFSGDIAAAGGWVVYPVLGGYAVTDLQGAAHPLGDLPVESVLPAQIAFDGRTLYGVRKRCHDERLLAVDTTVPAAAPLDLTPAPSLQVCFVRRAGPGRVRVAPDGGVAIRVRCPIGCQGILRLVEQRRGGRERLVGSVEFVSRGGTLVLRPRIARYARALAGCPGGLRVAAVVHRIGDGTRGLGPYRIVSDGRCRRTGGPAFAPPRPWPRP